MKQVTIYIFLFFIAVTLKAGTYKDLIDYQKFFGMGVGAYSTNQIAAFITKVDVEADTISKATNAIIETKNAGLTWDTLLIHTRIPNGLDFSKVFNEIYNIYYFNDSTIICRGKNSMILRTGDGGKTWDSLTIGDPTIGIAYVMFYPSGLGHVISNNALDVYRSVDKGKTWNILKLPYQAPNTRLDCFIETPKNKVYFFDDWERGNSGYAYFGSGVYRTPDDGITWEKCDSVADCVLGGKFINDTLGFVFGHKVNYTSEKIPWDSVNKRPVVYKTEDSGKKWKKIYEAPYFYGLTGRECYYNAETNVFAIDVHGGLLQTFDLGKTWEFRSNFRTIKNDSDYAYNRYAYQVIINENQTIAYSDRKIWLYTESITDVKEAEQEVSESFPNPVSANSVFNLNAEIPDGAYTSQLYEYMGGVVEKTAVNFASGKASYALGAVSPGAYILALNIDGQTIRYKIAVR